MTTKYTTIADVSAELGGIAITGATTPTSTVVDGWIQDAEAEVEILSGQVYATTAISSSVWEYHDYDGSGVIRLDQWPVQSVELIQYESKGLGAAASTWVTLVGPGRVSTDNFILYGAVGALRLIPNSTGNNPSVGRQNIRVAYTYGHTSVPRNVKEYCSKLAAKRYVESIANNSGTTQGGAISVGAISISDPSNFIINRVTQLDADIDRLRKQLVGKFRVVNYDLDLYG